eukprot:3513643-Pleurochrysis_carterae.AAC.4
MERYPAKSEGNLNHSALLAHSYTVGLFGNAHLVEISAFESVKVKAKHATRRIVPHSSPQSAMRTV